MSQMEAERNERSYRGDESLDEVLFDLAINFLLYVVLIVVFYMFVRFYLEEETVHSHSSVAYSKVATSEEVADEAEKGIAMSSTSSSSTDEVVAEDYNESTQPTLKKMKRNNSFLNLNEWGEPEGTKQEVLARVAACAAGLVICFSIWGLLQERILTMTYDGEYFVYSYGLVFITRLGGLILSAVLMISLKVDWEPSPLWEYSYPAVANMLSSWCQYEALKYVSFPTQMLAKAFKMVPVMLMGKFLHNKTYEPFEYVSACLVGVGLYLFIDSAEPIEFSQNVFGDPEGVKGSMIGVVLLGLFLFFDSFTGQWQTRMFQLNKKMSPLQMMLTMNAFSAVFSFITLLHQEQLYPSLYFAYRHPWMLLDTLGFTIVSIVGQLFIFYTVKNFGAVVFSIIMSFRILFSILLSCLVYSHPVTEMGMLGMLIVFGAMGYRIKRKTEGGNLLRWKESEEAKVIFAEWHEHLDI